MTTLTIPLNGLSAAEARLNRAADRIVQAPIGGQGEKAGAAASRGHTGGPPENGRVQGLPLAETTPAGAIVDLKLAEHAYKANLTALKTMAETQDSLLEIKL